MKTVRFVSCVFAILAAAVTGCGGSVLPLDEGSDGSGGAADGASGGSAADDGAGGGGQDGGSGSGNAPGSGGTAPVTGGASGAGGEPQCCLAAAVCHDGDLQVESESDCPIGGECYSSTICCSTVWCMTQQPLCDALPVCAPDETEVDTCLEGRSCVKRALCGTVITCQKVESFCDISGQAHREYLGQGDDCVDLELSCPEHTTPFNEACGCGCEQPESCPLSVGCLPGGGVHPLCNSDECPYTARPQ